jgi:hypothetical protein
MGAACLPPFREREATGHAAPRALFKIVRKTRSEKSLQKGFLNSNFSGALWTH